MKLEERINQDIKISMVEKSAEKLSAIRLIKAAIQVEKAKDGKEVTDEGVIKLIQKLVNQSNDSATQYNSAGRKDLAEKELMNVSIYKNYLPEQMSETEVVEKLKVIISETGASSIRDMGKVMAIVNKDFLGKADMKMVGGIVKNLLT